MRIKSKHYKKACRRRQLNDEQLSGKVVTELQATPDIETGGAVESRYIKLDGKLRGQNVQLHPATGRPD